MSATSENPDYGRFCNNIIRNMSLSFIAEKHNLKTNYSYHDKINKLGIKLFSGEKVWRNTVIVKNKNFFKILKSNKLDFNVDMNHDFFQTLEISNMIKERLISQKKDIMENNPFKERFNNNKDLFIHIRLGDVPQYNPGLNYYLKCLKILEYDKIYVSSDSPEHPMIEELKNIYPKIEIKNYDEVETIQFGSTCSKVVLSHGSFSAVIGYVSFFSDVYYPDSPVLWGFIELFEGKNFKKISPLHN